LVALGVGEALVVYSDGVTEALNEGQVFFGDERLLGSLRETAGRSAAEIARHLLGSVEAFVGEARWHDDVSLVIVRRAGRGSDCEPGDATFLGVGDVRR
jgi:sigma-B regulation protein RsbU (phosphoserine phosphatase)